MGLRKISVFQVCLTLWSKLTAVLGIFIATPDECHPKDMELKTSFVYANGQHSSVSLETELNEEK